MVSIGFGIHGPVTGITGSTLKSSRITTSRASGEAFLVWGLVCFPRPRIDPRLFLMPKTFLAWSALDSFPSFLFSLRYIAFTWTITKDWKEEKKRTVSLERKICRACKERNLRVFIFVETSTTGRVGTRVFTFLSFSYVRPASEGLSLHCTSPSSCGEYKRVSAGRRKGCYGSHSKNLHVDL
jgi:hypothetical protein